MLAIRYTRELQRHEFEVVTVHDVKSATRAAQEQAFDVALRNLGIPIDSDSPTPEDTVERPTNGLNLCMWLDEEFSTPIFVITGGGSDWLRECPFPIIFKPIADFEAEVVTLLNSAVGR